MSRDSRINKVYNLREGEIVVFTSMRKEVVPILWGLEGELLSQPILTTESNVDQWGIWVKEETEGNVKGREEKRDHQGHREKMNDNQHKGMSTSVRHAMGEEQQRRGVRTETKKNEGTRER